MKLCIKCWKVHPPEMFHADTRSGWSTICKGCRQRNEWRRKKRLQIQTKKQREYHQRLASKKAERIKDKKIKALVREFNYYTLDNKKQIWRINKLIAERPPDKVKNRTLATLERRMTIQKKAEELLEYQKELINQGVTPPNLLDLWSSEYGNLFRKPSEETNQEDS